jgi:glycosyltransferase involved in cell wall biosynthesis
MAAAFERQGVEVIPVGPLHTPGDYLFRQAKRVSKLLFGHHLHPEREPLVLRSYAEQVKHALRGQKIDAIWSPGILPIVELDLDIPIGIWTDCTFACYASIYPESEYGFALKRSRLFADRAEALALKRASLAVFSSEWAAKSAINDYGAASERVVEIPFGANFGDLLAPPTPADLDELFLKRQNGGCKLLFIGVEWKRKGGEKAVRIVEAIRRAGVAAELHVVGCKPDCSVPGYVVQHGFLRKDKPQDVNLLRRLLIDSHFFLLPTQAECFGIVFAEASAFCLPSFATNVGGVSSVVREGINGYTFALDAPPEVYAGRIIELHEQPKRYRDLAESAYQDYCKRLNWESAGALAVEKLRGIL